MAVESLGTLNMGNRCGCQGSGSKKPHEASWGCAQLQCLSLWCLHFAFLWLAMPAAKGCCPNAPKVSVAQPDFGGTLRAMPGVQRQEVGGRATAMSACKLSDATFQIDE